MTTQRRIARIEDVPALAPGFAGPGHTAAPVISMEEFARTDPFIALMDDHLDMGERQVGGAHPHAGFETVTLLLDGTTWWAHFEFTRINIEAIILRKKIEDWREVSAFTALARRISRKRIRPSGQRT